MKAYSFSFNASDWLASNAVKLMSKAERGVYINLLASAWESPRQGTLPASADKVRRLAEMSPEEWEVSSETILEKFPLSECGTYRYNPRLLAEAEKQEQKRGMASEAGRKSAEKRAAEKAAKEAAELALQQKGNRNATGVEINPTDVDQTPNGTPTISRVELSKEINKSIAARGGELATPSKSQTTPAKEPGAGRPAEYHYDEAPVFRSKNFNAYLDSIGFHHVDKAMYLLRISNGALKAVDSKKLQPQATNEAWQLFIQRWLDSDKAKGKLLLPDAAPAATGNRYNPPAAVAATPTTTGYSIADRVQAQATKVYI